MTFSVTKRIGFCYGHRLLGHDGKCRHLHGHNGVIEITIEKPELDELGMVMDFAKIKEAVKRWIGEELDHRMILSEDDPLLPVLREKGEPVVALKGNPTAEAIAKHVYDFCRSRDLPVSSVLLRETPDSCAVYRED